MGCPTGNYCFVFVFALVLRVMRASEEERREKYRESRKQSWSVSNKKMVAEAQRCANVMFMTSRVACCVTVLRSFRVPLKFLFQLWVRSAPFGSYIILIKSEGRGALRQC